MRHAAVLLGFAALLLVCPAVKATEPSERVFANAVQALQRGAYGEAIDAFELLADRGFVHPDASFNRAVAYVERARSRKAERGDLGRAVAALSEVLALRSDDREAETGLERIRAEIARRHASEGVAPVMARPSLGRAVTGLAAEDTWALAAAAGSALLTLGLALRSFVRRPAARISGAIATGLGALLLFACGGLTAFARHYRLTSEPAVVVVPEARLLDETGKPLVQRRGMPESVTLPEGADVHVLERRPNLTRIEWGSTEGWVTPAEIFVLPRR